MGKHDGDKRASKHAHEKRHEGRDGRETRGRGEGEGQGGGNRSDAGGTRFATLAAATTVAAVLATVAGTGMQWYLAQQSRADSRQAERSQFAQVSLALAGGA